LENSGGFHYFTNALSWPQYILEEQLRRQLTKTKLRSYKRRVVKLIGWKVAWKEGTHRHFATAMTKLD